MSDRIMAPLIAAVRFFLFLCLVTGLAPIQLVLLASRSRGAERLPMVFHRLVLRLFGFRIRVIGAPSTVSPTLFVANHTSYVDIEVLGMLIRGCFVAKAEVAGWPLFGWLARMQRTVFVDRRIRTSADQRDSLTQRLQRGENLILFPEGTSNDGNHVLPFKSALFAAAEIRSAGRHVAVQPVTVAYTGWNGFPMGRDRRDLVAWIGDTPLASHLWRLIGVPRIDAVVQFHPVTSVDAFGSRKRLSEHCERTIRAGLAAANSGRLPPDAPAPAASAAADAPGLSETLPAPTLS